MIKNKETVILKDGMDNVLSQLNALQGMLGVLVSGFEAEDLEQQAVDCMACIDRCVDSICSFIRETIREFNKCIGEEDSEKEDDES